MLHVAVQLCRILFRRGANADVISKRDVSFSVAVSIQSDGDTWTNHMVPCVFSPQQNVSVARSLVTSPIRFHRGSNGHFGGRDACKIVALLVVTAQHMQQIHKSGT